LRNTGDADGRYQEVVDIVLGRKRKTEYYGTDYVIRDTISLEGNDWTFTQHKTIDTRPTEADFRKTVSEYLSWEIGQVLRGERDETI
jgi:hypothetical protein